MRVRIEIELRQIQYFLAVAQERSFTRAATRCHVAQPSLSRQIAMEEVLGARLFERLPRDVRITTAGKVFEKEAGRALEYSRRATSLVRALEREHHEPLNVGLSILCDLPRVRRLVEAAQRQNKQSPIEYVTGHSSELCLSLLRGKLDLAVVDLPIRDHNLSALPLWSEPLISVLPHGHPLSVRPMVRLFEIRKERIVCISRQIDFGAACIETMLLGAGSANPSFTWTSNLTDLLDHVAAYRTIGLIRTSAGRLRREAVIYKPLADSVLLETAVAWRKESRNPHILSLRDEILAFSRESIK